MPDAGESFFQVGLVVPELEPALEELSAALGLTFGSPVNREIGPWRIRVAFAKEGPPFLEVIEGAPGTPWDTAGSPRVDHLGWWSSDLDADEHAWSKRGLLLEADGRPHGRPFTYHRAPASGLRMELIGTPPAQFYERWDLGQPR